MRNVEPMSRGAGIAFGCCLLLCGWITVAGSISVCRQVWDAGRAIVRAVAAL